MERKRNLMPKYRKGGHNTPRAIRSELPKETLLG
jgi:hypothetical protein